MKLPELRIGNLVAKVPIIQGGMAIRLSTARLAAAVANEGGIGLIAASGLPFDELRYEIQLARKLSPRVYWYKCDGSGNSICWSSKNCHRRGH